MADRSKADEVPADPLVPIEPPTPKRGAIPTPKSEIEKAKPFIPEIGADDVTVMKPPPQEDVDDKGDD